MKRALVIGVGNSGRRDDAAGLEAARLLHARRPPGVTVLRRTGNALSLIEAWRGASRVVVVDAASGGGAPGSVRRFDAHREPLPESLRSASSHSWGVPEAIEMARALGQLPPQLAVYGVVGRSFAVGQGLSAEVQRAIDEVVQLIVDELATPEPADSAAAWSTDSFTTAATGVPSTTRRSGR